MFTLDVISSLGTFTLSNSDGLWVTHPKCTQAIFENNVEKLYDRRIRNFSPYESCVIRDRENSDWNGDCLIMNSNAVWYAMGGA